MTKTQNRESTDRRSTGDKQNPPVTTVLGFYRQYIYPEADTPALREVSITIPARSKVGIVGSTGSGKTTAVDLILGLLRPQEGALVVDDRELIDALVREWQRSLGCVPQHIFLSDETVAGNIAFGLPAKEVDMNAVERAAKIANLHEFVVKELSEG
jgi:ATP-binding cassette, subfamily B, bacterial PglK